jgi:hypothetical protein
VEAPEGTDEAARMPLSKVTLTRMVGLPRESRICMALIPAMRVFMEQGLYICGA